MATKDYSIKQEKLIANYLDWECVSASGARDCHPGDVISDSWMGECKTHVASGKRIQFVFKEWMKIYEEATSKFKFPVLFVDDGSQTIENTWCMLDAKTAPIDSLPRSSQVIAKSSLFLTEEHVKKCDSSKDKRLMFNFNGKLVLLMRLTAFKNIC